MTTIHCSQCGEEKSAPETAKGNPRPPRGWKSIEGVFTCGKCWQAQYQIAAVTIPIYSADWEVLRPALKQVFAACTAISNWAQRRLLQGDIIRDGSMDKLPKMPAVYLYGEAKTSGMHAWEDIDKANASALLQQVEQKYRSQRYEIIWTCERAPATYRYPQPAPARPDTFRLYEREDDGAMMLNVRLGGERHTVMLARGKQFARQLAGLRWLAANPHLMAQGALYEVPAHRGDNRAEGSGPYTRLLFKAVGWFPVKDRTRTGTLHVRTDSESLVSAVTPDGDRIWQYHADHAKRIADRHNLHGLELSRMADDRKAEKRKPKRKGQGHIERLREMSRRDRNRMTSLCHEVSASVVAFAVRQRAAQIIYSDSDQSFCGSFPYAKLRVMIHQKCRREGIDFLHARSAVAGKPA